MSSERTPFPERSAQARSYDREILRLGVPALGALVAEPLYVLVDTAIVGHLGTAQLAGLGVGSTLVLTAYSALIFLAYGTTGPVARLLGAGQRARAAAHGVQGMWLAGLLGVALLALGQVFADPLVDLMGATGRTRTYALEYFRISLVGVPALTTILAGTGYLRGLQDTRTPLVVALTTALANVVLEILFVFVWDWGIAGSAWSTVLVQLVGALAYVRVVARDVRANEVSVRPDWTAIRAQLRVSGDLFIRTVALRTALLITTAVATRIGTTELAAHQIVFETFNLLALLLDSVAIAAQALVGRYLGAGDVESARGASRRMVEWGVVMAVVAAAALVALRTVLPGVFTDDDAVAALATFLYVHLALLMPVSAVCWVLDGVLIGAGDLGFLAKAMLVTAVGFGGAAILVGALGLGIGWVWGAFWVGQTIRFVGLTWRWRGDAWAVPGAVR